MPIKPKNAQLSVDVIPGCHKNAELFYRTRSFVKPYAPRSTISFHTVSRFLESCGTRFDWDKLDLSPSLKEDQLKKTLLDIFDREKSDLTIQGWPREIGDRYKTTTRAMHYYNEIRTNPSPRKKYVNLLHQELVTGELSTDMSNCILSVKDPDPQPSFWNGQKSLGYTPMFIAASSAVVYAASTSVEDNSSSIRSSFKF